MKTEAKVGAFVIVSLLTLGVTTYFVRTTQSVRGQVPYKTYLRYAGGLAPGAAVLFGGIKVGQVTAVQPGLEDPTRIEIAFNVKTDTPINQNSTARVGSVSLMSSPVLLISTGSNDARRLIAGEAVASQESMGMDELTQRVATVADSANSLVTELRGEVPALTGEARKFIANLNEISGPRNRERIEEILTQLHGEVPALTGEARKFIANLNEISGARNQERIEKILAEVNTLLNRESPKIAQITERISLLAQHADSVVVSAGPVVQNLDRTVTNANKTIDAIGGPLTKELAELACAIQEARALLANMQNLVQANEGDISETMQNLRSASENARALSELLRQRPWNLLLPQQPPDRKVPK
jgi:phospholipid/cholesterol/gamma-HCH transport system substrate-binding protein